MPPRGHRDGYPLVKIEEGEEPQRAPLLKAEYSALEAYLDLVCGASVAIGHLGVFDAYFFCRLGEEDIYVGHLGIDTDALDSTRRILIKHLIFHALPERAARKKQAGQEHKCKSGCCRDGSSL